MVGWIKIYNEEDLMKIADGLNKNYILMNDITLTKEWLPIGDNTNKFSGTLEGNGYKISGLNIENSTAQYQGLFGQIGEKGKVSNLKLEGTITAFRYIGLLAGYSEGIIKNVKIKGIVIGESNIGGLVGFQKGIIEKCYCEVTVTGSYDYVGGLVGYNNLGIIRKCASIGNVKGKANTGGLVGFQGGTIENVYSTGEVYGTISIGGLIGANYGAISNAYTISKVTGILNDDRVGGLIGSVGTGNLENIYWTPEKAGIKENGWWGTKVENDELMKKQESYVGFDFTSESPIWVMKEYPELNYNFGEK